MPKPSFVRLSAVLHQRRVLLVASGPDTRRFLQGIVTNQVQGLKRGTALASAILTQKGKIVSDLILVDVGSGRSEAQEGELVSALGLFVPEAHVDEIEALLERHIIMDDVTVERRSSELGFVWPEPGFETPASWPIEVGRCSFPAPGLLAWGASDELDRFLGEVAEPALPDAFEAHRVASRIPATGREIVPGMFPPEVGFAFAVDYQKGCYLGQEPLARIHAQGQVQRVMVGVQAVGPGPQPVLGPITLPDGTEVGKLTSLVPSETGWEGLAIVKRTFAVPGQTLCAGDAALSVTTPPCSADLR